MLKLSEQLRGYVRNCGQSVYAVSQASGVSQSVLSRFLAGERSPTLDTAEKLVEVLGLELRPRRGRASPKPRKQKQR